MPLTLPRGVLARLAGSRCAPGTTVGRITLTIVDGVLSGSSLQG
jgi:hypothetical protein